MGYNDTRKWGSEKKKSKGDLSPEDKLKDAQSGLLEKLSAIIDSDAPVTEKMSAAAGVGAQGMADSPLMKAISLIDIPRSAIAATGVAIGAGLREVITGEDDARAGFDQWKENVGRHIGFGDIIEENTLFDDLDGSTAGDWTKRVVGFAGDVAMDPLTYLAPQAKLEKLGKDGVARIAATAAETATEEGTKRALGEITQKASKGLSTLSDADLALVSKEGQRIGALGADELLEGGLYLNKPGTGRVGRYIGDKLGMEVELKQAKVGSGRLNAVPKFLRNTEEAVRNSSVGKGASRLFVEEQKRELVNLLRRSADPEVARGAFIGLEGANHGANAGAKYLAAMEQSNENLRRAAEENGISGTTISRALAGDVAATEEIVGRSPQLWTDLQAAAAAARDSAHQIGSDVLTAVNGKEVPVQFLAERPFWAPGVRGEELSKLIGSGNAGGKAGQFGPSSMERMAKIIGGGEFMGEQLLYSTDEMKTKIVQWAEKRGFAPEEIDRLKSIGVHKEGWDPRRQAQAIYNDARQELGEDPIALFQDDFWKAKAVNDRLVAKRLEGEVMKQHMLTHGVGDKVFFERVTPESEAAVAKAARQSMELESAKAAEQAAGVKLYDANAKLTAAKDDVLAKTARVSADKGTDARRIARERLKQADQFAAKAGKLDETLAKIDEVWKSSTKAADNASIDRDVLRLREQIDQIDAKLRQEKGMRSLLFDTAAKLRSDVYGDQTEAAELLRRMGVSRSSLVDKFKELDDSIRRGEYHLQRRKELLGKAKVARTEHYAQQLGFTPSLQGLSAESTQAAVDAADKALVDASRAYAGQKKAVTKLSEGATADLEQMHERAKTMLDTSNILRQSAQDEWSQSVSRALQIEGTLDEAAVAFDAARGKRLTVEEGVKLLGDPKYQTEFVQLLKHNWREVGINFQLQNELADAVEAGMKVFDDHSMNVFLRSIDWVTNVFKSYAVMTPGFHFRNFFSGMFNNYLAGIEPGAYGRFVKADWTYSRAMKNGASHQQALAKVNAKHGEKIGTAYRLMGDSGILGFGGVSSEVGAIMHGGRPYASLKNAATEGPILGVTNNPATRVNYFAMGKVERALRGSLAMDTILQGGNKANSVGTAVEKVFKYHFNYDDLSRFEKNAMKRISPFYTWSRKNIPLQLEGLFVNPKAYSRYYQLKHNLELGTDDEQIVPSWYGEQMAIHLPIQVGGGDLYAMPDLPFKDLNDLADPGTMLGSLNPIVKAPLEAKFGKQLYSDIPFKEGYQPMPNSWNTFGLGPALEKIGIAKTDKNGGYTMKDQDMYLVEQFMPLMGRLRRAFPSEEKHSQRFGTTMASMLFGAGVRTNTASDQRGEVFRREKDLDEKAKDLRSLGFGGYYEFDSLVKQEEKGVSPSDGRATTKTVKYGPKKSKKKSKSSGRSMSNVELAMFMETRVR